MTVHLGEDDIERREVDGGWFEYLEYPTVIYVVHLEATEKGAGNRVLTQVMDFAREKGKGLWGTVAPSGTMEADRVLKWYEKRVGARVVGTFHDHDVVKADMR